MIASRMKEWWLLLNKHCKSICSLVKWSGPNNGVERERETRRNDQGKCNLGNCKERTRIVIDYFELVRSRAHKNHTCQIKTYKDTRLFEVYYLPILDSF